MELVSTCGICVRGSIWHSSSLIIGKTAGNHMKAMFQLKAHETNIVPGKENRENCTESKLDNNDGNSNIFEVPWCQIQET